MNYFLVILISYLIGCFQTSYIFGKVVKKIDIREHGSGNPGATNAMRVFGFKIGFMCLLIDLLKGVLSVYISTLFFTRENIVMMLVAGVFTIIGHSCPFYMNFKGGKGVASTLGVFLMINPLVFLCAGVPALIALLSFRIMSVASLTFEFFILVFMIVFYFSNPDIIWIALLTAFFTTLAFYRHRANFKRLKDGTEPRLWEWRKKNEEQQEN